MPSLKELRNSIKSVKSTQKITKAMKLVAAAKLRRARENAEAARPYAERMEQMLSGLRGSLGQSDGAPRLLMGTGKNHTHLVIVATSDRGLCGGFNATIIRAARQHIRQLLAEGKEVKIFCIGKKGRDALIREYKSLIIETKEDISKAAIRFDSAKEIAATITGLLDKGGFDVCTLFYNKFLSVISQQVTQQQLIPLPDTGTLSTAPAVQYEYEPSEAQILDALLPRNLEVQIFRALLENAASEQGARMTAMDNATRNAGDMINRLTLRYNRTRQAVITKELIEIISGAEAL